MCRPAKAKGESEGADFKQYSAINLIRLEGCTHQVDLWKGPYYDQDPCKNTRAPPIENVHAIFGVNRRTQVSYAYKRKSYVEEKGNLYNKYELDKSAKITGSLERQGLTIEAGVIYEGSHTVQSKPGSTGSTVERAIGSGDGTVPFSSLQHVRTWATDTNVTVDEMPGVEHRAILADPNFHELLRKYLLVSPDSSLVLDQS